MRPLLRDTALTTAFATGLALIGVAATPVVAQAEPTRLYPPSALVLSVAKGEDMTTATVERAVTLSCAPTATGTHPAPKEACEELDAVDGDFGQLTRANAAAPCTRIWDPVTVTGEGIWKGKRVTWSATYGNRCEMNVGMWKNSVFAF
ncbi:subtilase-type protease inhibitor [Streptomyces sp. NPDC058579]|uniref:subtilase-type protease inhibitor n=1 Tax=Streptomyces sp. NPDC058579 TaxID=3346548 RepID=UPI003663414B